jgi:formylglycine-generating enzyme required for sulfatase activity
MPFDIAAWKRNLHISLKSFKADARHEGPSALYYGLCATALLPLAQEIQSGGFEQANEAAIALAGAVGGNLLANLAQKLADREAEMQAESERQQFREAIAQETVGDARIADALDMILVKLSVIEQVRSGLGKDDRAWFTETLRAQLRDLGSSITINAQGAVVLGDVHVQNGDFVGRDKIVNIYGAANVDWAAHYLRQLRAQCNRLPLADMGDREDAENAREVITLDQVYVTLKVEDPNKRFERIAKDILIEDENRDRSVAARIVIARSELAVLHGAPGSGKSAFVRQLAADLCAAQLGEAQLPGVMRPMRDLCPIVVNLRELAQRLKALNLDGLIAQDKRKALQKVLWEQWQSELDALDVPDFKGALRVKLLDGKALLVFDGLDEVAPDVRPLARDAVNVAIKMYAKPPRVIVTVRSRSFDPALMPDFDAYELQPFDGDQIREFSRRWYAVQAAPRGWPADHAEAQGDDLASAATGLPNDLASNPLLLTVIAIVHQDGKKLPPQRVLLFDKAIEVLLRRWQRAKGRSMSAELSRLLDDDYRIHGGLSALAYAAHDQQANVQRSNDTAADLTSAQIVALLSASPYLRSEAMAREFLGYVDECAGLLVGNGGQDHTASTYAFPHRTFQEYLAGRHMMAGRSALRAYREKARQGDYWERAAQLGAEAQFYTPGNRDKLLDLIYNLCPPEPPKDAADWRAALWSANMAVIDAHDLDWIKADHEGANDPALQGGEAYLTRARQRLLAIMRERRLPAIERAAAGRALAKLGDPREEVLTVEKMVFVKIDAGEFLAGEGKYKSTIQHPFWISQYPITNAQFQQFVDDGGYTKVEYAEFWREAAELGWWQAGKGYKGRYDNGFRAGPAIYRDDAFALPNHPVVGVSWHEALAFTRWLGTRTPPPTPPLKGRGYAFRLPTEWEWERAARGTDGRIYPWGEKPDLDLANYDQTLIGSTSAVGCFSRQDHWPNDCEDMSGNVWEWNLSRDERRLYYLSTDGDDRRMLYGGSWNSYQSAVSAFQPLGDELYVHQNGHEPEHFSNDCSFRVVYGVVTV